jgi:amino-acid N-acetyltransferase
LDFFVVVEREGQIIACAALFPFFEEKCGEVAAIAVSPECRGQGQGDKLLGMLFFVLKVIKIAILCKIQDGIVII